jgi:hypothetical protein
MLYFQKLLENQNRMKIIKKIKWCPQPQNNNGKTFSTAVPKLSPRTLAFIILAEVIVLLIAPLTYYALFVSNNYLNSEGREIALTNSQIQDAWPNLPTGDQIKNSNITYNDYTGIFGPIIQNRTRINMFSNFGVVKIPIAYLIYVQDSNGSWVEVPSDYLATDNPPKIQPTGFMGTDLSATYVIIAVIITIITLTIGSSYLLLHRKNKKY